MKLLTAQSLQRAWGLVKRPFSAMVRAQADAVAPPPSAPLPPGLERIIVPSARDRWRGRRVASYTMESIEQILASAFDGDLRYQWELFDLMEETTPRLMKVLNEIKRAVITLDWPLQPWSEKGAEPTPSAIERAKLCEGAIW